MTRTRQAAMLAAAPAPRVPVAQVVGVFETELSKLAALGDDLQDALAAAALDGRPGAEFLTQAQNLDLMVQRLRSLASFLALVAPSLPERWRVDPTLAARELTLSSLERRLSSPAAAPPEEHAQTGDFDLF